MHRGAVFVGGGDSFLSNAIKSVTKSRWSHCGIITDTTDFESYVLSARDKGVDLTTLTEYNNDAGYYYRIYDISLPQEEIDAILRPLVDEYLGKPYGYLQLAVGFPVWYKLRDWFGITLKRNPVSFWTVCSELNATYLNRLGFSNWDPDLTVPEHVFQLMEKWPGLFNLSKEKLDPKAAKIINT